MSDAVAAWRAERARRLAEYEASLLPPPETPAQRRFRNHHEALRRRLDEAHQRRLTERWTAWRAEQDVREQFAAEEARAIRERDRAREEARAAQQAKRALLRPAPRLIRDWRDAERAAAEWMPYLKMGFGTITGGGRDGGVDVYSDTHVVQVKLEAKPTGSPAVQQLFGVAAAHDKLAAFFTLAGYTDAAVHFAAENGIRLYRFDWQGEPELFLSREAQELDEPSD